MKQYSISILKKEWAKYRGLSLQKLMEKHVFPREDMYDVQIVQEINNDFQSSQELIEKTVRQWAERKMLRTINGIVLEINDNGISIARYIEENGTIIMPNYYRAPDDLIGMESSGIYVPGFPKESWQTVECINVDGTQIFLLESERFPETRECLVVNGKLQVIMQTIMGGFSNSLIEQIREKMSVIEKSEIQTITFTKGYYNNKNKVKNDNGIAPKPNNYDTLSLREKIELNKSQRT